MRNLLSHHGRIDGSPVVLPSEQALKKLLEILEYAKNPPMALSLATPAEKLCRARLSDELSKILEIMEKRGYSHIPVLTKNKGVFGVFSVGTLFSYARSNPQSAIEGMTLRDMSAYLPPEKHTTEKFAFVSPEASLYDIKELFTVPGPNHRRVAAVFVTEDGRQSSRLLGMITPWDVFKAEGAQMIYFDLPKKKVSMLRKESDGYVLDLANEAIPPIPITKTYTDSVLSYFTDESPLLEPMIEE